MILVWKIFIILAIWSYTIDAQYGGGYTENSRGGRSEGGRLRSILKIADYYGRYNTYSLSSAAYHNNTIIYFPQLPNHAYNKNSRDSFGYTNTLLFSGGKESLSRNAQTNATVTEDSLLTISAPFSVNSTRTHAPTTWKISTSNSFEPRLFDIMSTKAQYENLVYSPISVKTLLSLFFTMSDGKLYEELSQLLAISKSRAYVANVFENISEKLSIDAQPTMLIMANKLYYDYRFGPIDQSVRNIASKSFSRELEQIIFFEPKKAANSINSWVKNKTRNLIKEIVTSGSISGETSALLLNFIYFKSEWLIKFAPLDTEKQEFFISQREKVPIDMMYNEDVFRYGDFSADLQTTVVELPYKTSSLSMILILPLDIEGLPNLERKLKLYDLNSMSQGLKREVVTVKLPKFQIEYEANMIEALQEMGLHALFNNAGAINLFRNTQKPLKVDQFKHKSVINVNEAGTEAAATTIAKYVPLSLPTDMKHFLADRPFVFVIRDTNTTLFMGHVLKF